MQSQGPARVYASVPARDSKSFTLRSWLGVAQHIRGSAMGCRYGQLAGDGGCPTGAPSPTHTAPFLSTSWMMFSTYSICISYRESSSGTCLLLPTPPFLASRSSTASSAQTLPLLPAGDAMSPSPCSRTLSEAAKASILRARPFFFMPRRGGIFDSGSLGALS